MRLLEWPSALGQSLDLSATSGHSADLLLVWFASDRCSNFGKQQEQWPIDWHLRFLAGYSAGPENHLIAAKQFIEAKGSITTEQPIKHC